MTFKIYHKLIKIERNCYKSYSNFSFDNTFSHYIEKSIKLIVNTYDYSYLKSYFRIETIINDEN